MERLFEMNKKLFDISFVVEEELYNQNYTEPAGDDDPGNDDDEADDLDGNLVGGNNMETDDSLTRPPSRDQPPTAGGSKFVDSKQKAKTVPTNEASQLDQFQSDQMVKSMSQKTEDRENPEITISNAKRF
ncbi:hypothetical protein C2845_PM11G20410 [Panicum miliaceum]|uniref:Uncharacterized protein n=1 Tax=Panicum miliaceum TaxID=4540 RepID=A0A3L6RVR7_PANMI|nr:hypothetical protein C2845_PM11G20410 [Panicum miliaceum]